MQDKNYIKMYSNKNTYGIFVEINQKFLILNLGYLYSLSC